LIVNILFKSIYDRDLSVVGIIGYENYSVQISSEFLKRVVRGETLHKVKALPEVFSGIIIQGRTVVPVLSRESFNSYIESKSDLPIKLEADTLKDASLQKQSSKKLVAIVTCGDYDFGLPLDEVLSIFDNSQEDKTDDCCRKLIALECEDLLNYILLQKGGSNEV